MVLYKDVFCFKCVIDYKDYRENMFVDELCIACDVACIDSNWIVFLMDFTEEDSYLFFPVFLVKKKTCLKN